MFAVPEAAGRTVTPELASLIEAEEAAGLFGAEIYQVFSKDIRAAGAAGAALTRLIFDARAEGRKIAGYGAPAKATTLMYQFGLKTEDLADIVDDSPWKQGLFLVPV